MRALQDLERPADTKSQLFRVTWDFPVGVGSPEMILTRIEREDETELWSQEPHAQFPISMGVLQVDTDFVELRREHDENLLINQSLNNYFSGYGSSTETDFIARREFRGHIRAYRYALVKGLKVYEDIRIEDVRRMTIFIFRRILNINISQNLSLIPFKGTANWITAWMAHGVEDQQGDRMVKISNTHPIFTNPNCKVSFISDRVKFPLVLMKLEQEEGALGNATAGYLSGIPFGIELPGWPQEAREKWANTNLKTVLVARSDQNDLTAPHFEAFRSFCKEIHDAASKPTQDVEGFLKNNITKEKFEDFFMGLKRQKSTFDFNADWRAAASPYRKSRILKLPVTLRDQAETPKRAVKRRRR
ncbi:hypothetical protein HYFRA_00006367 [Hymenoscyphus fraxineus]|uniref:Uncharacterized protein n=1 Tax=Hymenoscyphus fraxineus TaxID=746836 RepID=A0A9N9KRU3_9HELO|nr:hypothetical protein HYFRA_00006367 [Hymenoscyphus fraxineus]